MTTPLLSIIVATHDRPRLLYRSISSILNQGFRDFQLVVCCDEGSAETKQIVATLLRDSDVFVVDPKLKGPSGSRNMGMRFARGEFILFLDDDDSFRPNYFADLAEFLGSFQGNFLYSNFHMTSERRQVESEIITSSVPIINNQKPISNLWIKNFIPNNSIVLRRQKIFNVWFDDKLQSHEDWDFILALMNTQESFEYVNIFGPNVHIDENSSHHRNRLPTLNKSIGLDYLSVYRKWPAPSREFKEKRAEMLRNLGLDVSPEYL